MTSGQEEASNMETLDEPAIADSVADLANLPGRKKKIRVEKAQASPSSSKATEKASKREVSSNACEPCRKRKSKCDGKQPFCASCTTLYSTQCVYDLDNDLRRKSALRKKIAKLEGVRTNYQFILDSLCIAEEPHLSQLLQLIRSNQSVGVIADIWRSSDASVLDQLQATSLFQFGEDSAGNNFVGLMDEQQQVIEVAINQSSLEFGDLIVQSSQAGIDISRPVGRMSQPDMLMPDISSTQGNLDMRDTIFGIPLVPVASDQQKLPVAQGSDTFPPIEADGTPEANQDSIGWYDALGHLWPSF